MKKSLGDKRNQIGDGDEGRPNHIETLTKLYDAFKNDVRMTIAEIQTNVDPKRDQTRSLFVSKIFDNRDFGYLKITVKRPLRLNFAVTDARIERFKLTSAFAAISISRKRKDKAKKKAEELAGQAAHAAILAVLDSMKLPFANGQLVKDRSVFAKQLTDAFENGEIRLDGKLKDALLAPGSLGERDALAEICRDEEGKPEPDPELRDTENVSFPPGTKLPLPLEYEGKKNKSSSTYNPAVNLSYDRHALP
jgi:type I restriction enzyme M protein